VLQAYYNEALQRFVASEYLYEWLNLAELDESGVINILHVVCLERTYSEPFTCVHAPLREV